ncbi:MAG TPA: non-homologous end-joining DNA ligase [Dermatophilaceae bacterium]|jgi:bifunctional non-homologous end joining protein LigD|nr:non-homologous end-joining DNA ligase [Dermatophilaceae bacterium]
MRPMLATAARHVPPGAEWVHEVKWDGMRVFADVREGRLRLTSRTERDVTVAFPELAGLAALYPDMLLDGEIVLLVDGRPSFGALAERFHVTQPTRAAALAAAAPVTLMVFDIVRLFGIDLTSRTWTERRQTLDRLALADGVPDPHWQVPPTFDDGAALWSATREQGLEGIVSKRRTSRYAVGQRSDDWRKLPHRATRSVVIGGWRPETGRTDRVGAVLVGVPGPGGLHYRGRVGSGIAGKTATTLLATLGPLAVGDSPFVGPPTGPELPVEDATGARWVEPVLVCDVQSLGVTSTGRLRQPAYQRLRPDLTPADLPGLNDEGDEDG